MCLASTYCLAGMATPIVDVNNP